MDQLVATEKYSPYRFYAAERWAEFAAGASLHLTQEEVTRLSSLNDPIDLDEVRRIYLSMSRLLSVHVEASQTLFRERAVHKVYEAIVPWKAGTQLPPVRRSHLMDDASFLRTREAPGCEPNSETHMEVLEVQGGHARLRLSPVTGRKHQLRVHCAAMGMPILNDDYYPVLRPEGPDDFARPLQLLARSVAFTDPVTGQVRKPAGSAGCAAPGAGSVTLIGPPPSGRSPAPRCPAR